MKHLIHFLMALFVVLGAGVASAINEGTSDGSTPLYLNGYINVRFNPRPSAPEEYTIHPGESFEVIRWNKHNTRIKLKDGRIGWIDKELLEKFTPGNYTGYVKDNHASKFTLKADGDSAEFGGTALSTSEASEVVSAEGAPTPVVRQTPRAESTASGSKMGMIGMYAWINAIQGRNVANFLGGGFRSGNRSKGMCAQGLRETLIDTGLCKPSVVASSAIQMHRQGKLKSSNICPGLKLATGSKNPRNAADGSVIVYNRPSHSYGHIEIKVKVTQEMIDALKAKGQFRGMPFKVGQYMYCSDYCSARPIQTTGVAGIYNLK